MSSLRLLPVSWTFSALMTTTWSPQSMCGVYEGLCLPRRRMAMIEASRPSTRPSASISSHFLSISEGLAEKVFIARARLTGRPDFGPVREGRHVSDRRGAVKRSSLRPACPRYNMEVIQLKSDRGGWHETLRLYEGAQSAPRPHLSRREGHQGADGAGRSVHRRQPHARGAEAQSLWRAAGPGIG